MIKKCSSRAGISAFSWHPGCCRCELFLFVASYEICTTFLKDRVAVECARVRSSSDREHDRVAVELIWTTDWIGIALIGKRSGMGRIEVELIGYWSVFFFFYPDQTRSLHDRFPVISTATQPKPDHFPMASRVLRFLISTRIFWTCPKFLGRKPERCRAS